MIKLYQFEDCPFCDKVRRTLAKLGLSYEKVEVDYDRMKRPAIVLENNGKVPVLEDDGEIIVESEVIVKYLEDKYGGQKKESLKKTA